jgi:hypothetical protein
MRGWVEDTTDMQNHHRMLQLILKWDRGMPSVQISGLVHVNSTWLLTALLSLMRGLVHQEIHYCCSPTELPGASWTDQVVFKNVTRSRMYIAVCTDCAICTIASSMGSPQKRP